MAEAAAAAPSGVTTRSIASRRRQVRTRQLGGGRANNSTSSSIGAANTAGDTTSTSVSNGNVSDSTSVSGSALDPINEAATYYDADIEHTSTHIIVNDVKSGRSVKLTNDQLTCSTVRQLNRLVSGFSKQTILKLKQRRRTLKNRGYAQNCRHKRLDQKNKLERQNEELKIENDEQRGMIDELRLECSRHSRTIAQLREEIHRLSANWRKRTHNANSNNSLEAIFSSSNSNGIDQVQGQSQGAEDEQHSIIDVDVKHQLHGTTHTLYL